MIHRINSPHSVGRLNQPRVRAVDWWLAGGISPSNCIAAYQPKGAASYAASLTDLSGAGNDAYEGVAPDWDDVSGWRGDGSSMYLKTGITLKPKDTTQTTIVRFSDVGSAGNRYVFGCVTVGKRYALCPNFFGGVLYGYIFSNFNFGLGTAVLSGTVALGINGNIFVDGLYYGGTDTSPSEILTDEIFMLAVNNGGSPEAYSPAHIQAIAFYNTGISADQVLAVHTAMMAL